MGEIARKKLVKIRVVVAPDSDEDLKDLGDEVFCLNAPELRDEYRAPVDVMLAQSLGLFCSLKLGLKPDSPSPNGAINRVVNHVSIYKREFTSERGRDFYPDVISMRTIRFQ